MKEIFLSVLDMGVAGGWVILAVLVCRMLLVRVPKKYACLLWIPAGLRLVLPWRVSSPLSLFNLIRPGAAEVTKYGTEVQKFIPGDIGMAREPQISIGIPAADAVLSGSLPDATPMNSMNPMQFWEAFGTAVWCAGMAVMVVLALVQYVRLTWRVRTAVRAEENVYLSENVASPFILGVFRPKIYLPYGLDETLTKQVLLHERMHLRYRDPLLKILAYGILTVYWFHPLCWAAFWLFCRDVEIRCDEAVLERTEAAEYGKALVLLASGRRYTVTGPLAFGESSVKERVKHILHWKKPALWVSIGAVVVSAVLLVVCGTDGLDSPYGWMSEITVEDIGETSVRHRADGVWNGKLTPEQTEDFVQCLRNVPPDAIRPGREKQHFSGMVMDVQLRYPVTQTGSVQYIFRYDGEEVFLCSVDPSVLGREPAWYIEDADFLAFFAGLAHSMENGQGTLDPLSAEVSVYVSGTDTVIAPKHYEPGEWNHDYSELPVLTMTESGNLCIHVYWQPETLYVYEEYYNSLSSSATTIRRTTYTADGPHADGGYTIPVTRMNSKLDERAVYYIENGEEKYIFKVNFTDVMEMAAHRYVCNIAPCPTPVSGGLTDNLYIFTADTETADTALQEKFGSGWNAYGIRIFHSENTGKEANFWYPMYDTAGVMYKMQYVSIGSDGKVVFSHMLADASWNCVETLASLTSPEEPMILYREDEAIYALIGHTAYCIQGNEPKKTTLTVEPLRHSEKNVVVRYDPAADPELIPETAADAEALFDTLTEYMFTFNDSAKAIADCPDVYAALLHGGEVTMEYIFTELEREPESQKRSNVMTEVLRMMLGEEALDESAGKIPGMGYYVIWMETNRAELHNHGEAYMKENRPWGWLALTLAEKS